MQYNTSITQQGNSGKDMPEVQSSMLDTDCTFAKETDWLSINKIQSHSQSQLATIHQYESAEDGKFLQMQLFSPWDGRCRLYVRSRADWRSCLSHTVLDRQTVKPSPKGSTSSIGDKGSPPVSHIQPHVRSTRALGNRGINFPCVMYLELCCKAA